MQLRLGSTHGESIHRRHNEMALAPLTFSLLKVHLPRGTRSNLSVRKKKIRVVEKQNHLADI